MTRLVHLLGSLLFGIVFWLVLFLAVQTLASQELQASFVDPIGNLIPRFLTDNCFSKHVGPLRCQDAGHVVIHAGLVVAFDKLGGGLIKPKGAFWASFGFAVLSETVIGPIRHLQNCGSLGCGEPFYPPKSPLDGIADLVFRSAGAWMGLKLTRAL